MCDKDGKPCSDLLFAQTLIVELQHLVRILQDELANERAAIAALLREAASAS